MTSSTAEVEWDDKQQGWMVALSIYRGDLHACGHSLVETTAPDAEGQYVAELPIRCHACDAIEARQEEYKEAKRPYALLWRARRR